MLHAHNPVRGQKVDDSREGGRGRARGSPNYQRREIEKLLDLVEEELPIAAKGWRVVGLQFRDWAFVADNPTRTDRSLELKFKQVCLFLSIPCDIFIYNISQLVKTRKPTGDGICPPHVRRAHEIDNKLRLKVACRDLEDEEIANVDANEGYMSVDDTSDSNEHPEDTDRGSPARCAPTPRVRTARIEAPLPSQETVRNSSSKGTDLLEKISRTFDPEVQSRRDADRASSMFQAQQLILFQSQIRDLNTTILTLRTQLDQSERRRANANRRADRLQNRVDINSAVTRARRSHSTRGIRRTTPISVSSTSRSTPEHNRRYEATFRDGGHCSWFGNRDRFNHDDDAVEVARIPWSPSPNTRASSPPQSGYTSCEV